MKRPERETTPEYLNWLQDQGIICWRQNSGSVRVGTRTIKLGNKGMPDIGFILPGGRAGFCENKSNGSELTDDQIRWMDRARKQGALCFVARSLEDVVEFVGMAVKPNYEKTL